MADIFSGLSVARSALLAQSAAIRTVGQNIANVDAEGYTRQRVHLAAARPEQLGSLSVGTGVEISRIERMIDERLEASIRDAGTALKDLETRGSTLARIEAAFNELAGDGIGTALDRFFAALNDLAAAPEDHTLRSQVVAAADALGDRFRFGAARLRELRSDLNDQVIAAVEEINRATGEIAQLNGEIVFAESGGQDRGTANDLRDRRDLLIRTLAELVPIRAVETSTGAVNVTVGGDWLVSGDQSAALVTESTSQDGVLLTTARFASDGKVFAPASGTLGGLLGARDSIVPEARDDIDTLACTLIEEFNRVHSQGEGLVRLTRAMGTAALSSPTAALNATGLPFEIRDGRFTFTVKDETTGAIDRYDIAVNVRGSAAPTTLESLAAAIDAAAAADHPEIEATVTNDFRLEISSASASVTFGFEDDASGAVAALGLNTFFTGSDAWTIGVNDLVRDDVRHFAAGRGGGAGDNANVLAMLALRDAPLIEAATLETWWQGRIGSLGVESKGAQEAAENQQAILDHLTMQREALSGVSIDEEAISLIQHQRAYQAAARLLSVIDSLVATLLQAV